MCAAQGPQPLADPVIRGLAGRAAKYWSVELIIGAVWS